MRHIIGILTFIEIILVLVFPTIGPGNGSAFNTYGMYLLIPVAFILHRKNKILGKNDSIGRQYMHVLIRYVCMVLLGAIFASVFSSKVLNNTHAIFATIMSVLYAYVFYVLASISTVRRYINCAIILSAIILSIYSIYSYITQTNIYTDFFEVFFRSAENTQDSSSNDFADTRGLNFRVFGNVNNPVYFSGQLMLLQAYCTYLFLKKEMSGMAQISFIVIILLITVADMFTGSKSGILPSFAFIFYMSFKKFGFKKNIIIVGSTLILLVGFMPILGEILGLDLSRFFVALNPFNEETGGSSGSSRMEEFFYLPEFVGSDFLFGRGVGWCVLYGNVHGPHPILHTFESLIMSSYVEGGLWGLFLVYPLYLIGLYKLSIEGKTCPGYRLFLLGYYFFILVSGIGMTKFFYMGLGMIINEYKLNNK